MTAPFNPRPPRGSQDDEAMLDSLAQAASQTSLPDTDLTPPQQPAVLGSDPSHFEADPTDPTTSPQPPPTPHDESDLGGPLGSTIDGTDTHAPEAQLPAVIDDAEMGVMDPKVAKQVKQAAAALYGSDFPLLSDTPPTDAKWVAWAKSLWDRHRPGMQKILHTVEYHRLLRAGDQWVTSTGIGPYREPPKPRDAVRAVENVIQPALDQRVQILREQTPGFRTRPTSQDPDSQKKAEAQQLALEYSYAEQDMADVLGEAAYWVGTDGVAFLGPYWHPDAGPIAEAEQTPLGDVRTCVYRIEQVRVSANATATQKPHYWIVRETIPTASAVAMHGPTVVGGDGSDTASDVAATMQAARLGLDAPSIDELYLEQPTVERYTIYCDKSDLLKQGLQVIVCGDAVVLQPTPLLYGVVPLVRMTDGSSDPAFYPTPVMKGWVPNQIRINALKSKLIESIRVNAGGRFLMKSGATATETLVGGTTSFIEVKGAYNDIKDVVWPVQGFSVGNDVKDALEQEMASFEKKSGWNDASRGSFASDASGRAILAVREQLERIFAPGVAAASGAMTDWAKIVLHIYRAMLKLPRMMAITGQGRPDLAQVLTAEDFDGVSQVEIDPETLMPMPRSMRLYLLDQLYQTQVIGAQEYRRRLPFAFTGSINTPDDGQEARGQRVADAIKRGQPVPEIRWTDNEAIHQDVLEREILTQDALDPTVVQMALQRWIQLAQQAATKSGGGMAPMGAPAPNGGPPDGTPLPPTSAPIAGSNPSVAAAPLSLSQSDEQAAGSGFDGLSPQ